MNILSLHKNALPPTNLHPFPYICKKTRDYVRLFVKWDISPPILNALKNDVSSTYDLYVEVSPFRGDIADYFDQIHGQVKAWEILSVLEENQQNEGVWNTIDIVLIDDDMYDESGKSVFQLTRWSVSVLSMKRFQSEFYGLKRNEPLLQERITKMLVRSLGVIYCGFERVKNEESILRESINSLDDVDIMNRSIWE